MKWFDPTTLNPQPHKIVRIPRKYTMAPMQNKFGGVYHLVSRVVWRCFIFGEKEREMFVELMRKYESFGDLKVLGYCIMSNHVHLMVYVPPARPEQLSDEQFIKQLGYLYNEEHISFVKKQLARAHELQDEDERRAELEKIRTPYTRRMWNFSEFMKSLKQCFSRWYNKQESKCGTLWEGRFKHVVVQGGFHARFISAYIDLNPLRAGMIEDVPDYRWSNIGAAHGGVGQCRHALLCTMLHESTEELHDAWQARGREHMHEYLASIREEERVQKGPAAQVLKFDWNAQSACYRCFYMEEGQQAVGEIQEGQDPKVRAKRMLGYTQEDLQKAQQKGGKLGIAQMLCCRLRFATEGLILGAKDFVEAGSDMIKEHLQEAYAYRKQGAKKVRFSEGNSFYTHRQHTKDACQPMRGS